MNVQADRRRNILYLKKEINKKGGYKHKSQWKNDPRQTIQFDEKVISTEISKKRTDKRKRKKSCGRYRKEMWSIHKTVCKENSDTTKWQWLWLSWQSGRLRHQRSAVRIQSSTNFDQTFVFCQLCSKDENKEKEAGNGPFFN